MANDWYAQSGQYYGQGDPTYDPGQGGVLAAKQGGYNSQAYQDLLAKAGQGGVNALMQKYGGSGANAAWNATPTTGGATPGTSTPVAQPGAPGVTPQAGVGAVNNSMVGATSNTTPFNMPSMGSFDPTTGYNFAGMDANYVDPGFAFRLGVGNDLLQGSAAAKGNLQSGATLKAIQQYGQDMASQEASNAYNRYAQNRQFNYGVDANDRQFAADQANNDRNFAYQADIGDRNFNYGTLRDMMQFGLQGTGAQANTQDLLATLLSQNALSGGQAAGATTVGGSNAINSAISQFLQQYLSGQMLNRALPG